jgi:hypothetical protein
MPHCPTVLASVAITFESRRQEENLYWQCAPKGDDAHVLGHVVAALVTVWRRTVRPSHGRYPRSQHRPDPTQRRLLACGSRGTRRRGRAVRAVWRSSVAVSGSAGRGSPGKTCVGQSSVCSREADWLRLGYGTQMWDVLAIFVGRSAQAWTRRG